MLQISWTEVLGSLTGLVSVWLTVRNKVWCWFWGIMSVSLYVVVFWTERLYADMGLQLVFIVMNAYGWYEWQQRHTTTGNVDNFSQSPSRSITRIPHKYVLISLACGAGIAIALLFFLQRFTDAVAPEMDSALTATSLVALWMQAKRYREHWLVWLVADIAYVGLFVSRQLWLTSALYLVFCGMALLGWREWTKEMAE
ncbi:MAG: nicotinamide riboside transporter PnuC [Candidatus Kapaibacterium sp.]|nr:MAG: nicotinamide riboside transporter PnuC [Candidatus Kapabacteria bacterium]